MEKGRSEDNKIVDLAKEILVCVRSNLQSQPKKSDIKMVEEIKTIIDKEVLKSEDKQNSN